jgi:hypothetical protein
MCREHVKRGRKEYVKEEESISTDNSCLDHLSVKRHHNLTQYFTISILA